jgi:hypothetical protein
MKQPAYQERLKHHLAVYAQQVLGITQPGHWNGREYAHILPEELWAWNILPEIRDEFLARLKAPAFKRHKYFHHLSSSQAFALNLFLPFCIHGFTSTAEFFSAFGSIKPSLLAFEVIPDPKEFTNVDVSWEDESGAKLYCEVKLSENEFGTAENDKSHLDKLEGIYRPRLISLVPEELLEPEFFFQHYQILRNIFLLHKSPSDRLAFLLPKENKYLFPKLDNVLTNLPPTTRDRIRVVFVEDLLRSGIESDMLSHTMREHLKRVASKYLPLTN